MANQVNTFTEEVPTVPGWYWKRTHQGCTIVQLAQYQIDNLTHWKETKEAFLERVKNGTIPSKEGVPQGRLYQLLADSPDDTWVIEWAGPLQPPV